MAVMYLSGESGAVNNGFVYIGAAGYLIVLTGGAAGAFMLISVLKFVRQRNEQAHETAELAIDMKGDVLYCTGKVDSANFLKEPVSGRPVSLISADVARQPLRLEPGAHLPAGVAVGVAGLGGHG